MLPTKKGLFSLLLVFSQAVFSQIKKDTTKVGIVLSGGGAKGIAYIGVLRVLEENEIPIDYIVGTSIGGVVGGMYAAGYSPDEMEDIISNPNTSDIIKGRNPQSLNLFYNSHEKRVNFISLQFLQGEKNKLSFSPNVIKTSNMQLEFNKVFFKAAALSEYDFDHLFVPFRTIYSNIEMGRYEYKKQGYLANHIRASMNVPIIYPKHYIDGEIKFDGGIYNNFPIGVMKKEFNPNHIIGVKTGGHLTHELENSEMASENLRYVFIKTLVNNSDYYAMDFENDIYISPKVDHLKMFDFEKYKELIQIGEESAWNALEEIREKIHRRVPKKMIDKKRKQFKSSMGLPSFESLEITSRPPNSKHPYIRKILQPYKKRGFNYNSFETGYHRLASSRYFDNLNPQFLYDAEKKKYYINLLYDAKNKVKINFGGTIASQGLGFIYGGFEIQSVKKKMLEIYADFYWGSFKKYLQLGTKYYFPLKRPFFMEMYYKGSWYDYLKASKIAFENQKLVFFNLKEGTPGLQLGVPFLKKGLLTAYWEYYNGNYVHALNLFQYDTGDQLLRHQLKGPKFGLRFKKSSLDAPQHAIRGTHFELHLYRIQSRHHFLMNSPENGIKNYAPKDPNQRKAYDWNFVKLEYLKYVNFKKPSWLSTGLEIEASFSSKKNFRSTLIEQKSRGSFDINIFPLDFLTAPQFLPFWNSESYLSSNHTASSYVALGFDPIIHLNKKLQLRFPFYVYDYFFQEAPVTKAALDTKMEINPNLFTEYFINNGVHLIYKTPLIPIALGVNRYDALVNDKEEYNFFIKIGYTLKNKMQLK